MQEKKKEGRKKRRIEGRNTKEEEG